MSSYGYRLDRALTSVESGTDGRSTLRVLPPGSVLLVASGDAPAGMARVLCNLSEYCVFVEDLEDRSTRIAVDLRKPGGLCSTVAAGSFRWAC